VNVYGFAAGVFGAIPSSTSVYFSRRAVPLLLLKNEYVAFLGTLAFIGLGIYGVVEAGKIIVGLL